MLKKFLKSLACVLVIALTFTMFVAVPETKAASRVSQPAIYQNKIVLSVNSSAYPSNYTSIDKVYVYVSTNGKGYELINAFDGEISEVTLSGVTPYNRYGVMLKCDYTYRSGNSYRTSKGTYLGEVSNAAMAPVKVTGLVQSKWNCYSCSLNTVWDKQQSVSGYQYELYNYKGVKVNSGTSGYHSAYANFGSLALQTYRMRVRAYTTFNGSTSYGAWSDWLEIVPPVKSLTGKLKKKKVSLKWSKVPGATSYTIFVSTSRDTGYVATKTVSAKKTKATINKIGKKKMKSKKYYYIYVRPNRKVNGSNVFSTPNNASIPMVYGKVK